MGDTSHNPHDNNTPEWQLCEVAIASDKLAESHAKDSERSLKLSHDARVKAQRYWDALSRMAPAPKESGNG